MYSLLFGVLSELGGLAVGLSGYEIQMRSSHLALPKFIQNTINEIGAYWRCQKENI